MKVSDLSIMEVDVEVNESDIVRVGMNDEAEVEVDAYLDETFLGTVTEIGNTALNAGLNGFAMDQVTNFSVKVRLQPESYAELLTTLENAASPFRPGMSAKVDVLTRSADAVVSVPIQSVTTRESEADEEEDELGVFVLEPSGEVRWQRVETGIQDNRYIEIKSGLDPSLTVVTGPYQSVSRTLKDGDEVEIKATEKPEAER
jgi:HlyD family secretion protein